MYPPVTPLSLIRPALAFVASILLVLALGFASDLSVTATLEAGSASPAAGLAEALPAEITPCL